MAFVRFRVGEHYTNRDIVDTLHCDECAFLRSAEERGIVAICLNAAENPHFPTEIRVGGGPGRARLASALLGEYRHQVHKAVPLVVKDVAGDVVDVTPWRYLGAFRATGEEWSAAALATRQRTTDPVIRILYLTRVRD